MVVSLSVGALSVVDIHEGLLDDQLGHVDDQLGHVDDLLGHVDDQLGHVDDQLGQARCAFQSIGLACCRLEASTRASYERYADVVRQR